MNRITIEEKKDTKKDVKDWLSRYRFAESHLAVITKRLGETIALLEEASALLEKDEAGLDELVLVQETIDRLKHSLGEQVEKTKEECLYILSCVDSIPSPEIRQVIEEHYFNNLTLEACAIDLDMSLSKVKYLHRKGLVFLSSHYLP